MNDLNSRDKFRATRTQKIFLASLLGITLLAALAYICSPQTLRWFCVFGAASVLVNVGIFLYLAVTGVLTVNRDSDRLSNIIGGITLVIPFAIFYTVMVMVLRGFRLPFDY